MSDAEHDGEDAGEDVEKVAYTFAEREDWKRPRAISGPARTNAERQDAEDAFVDANTGTEYASAFLATRFLAPENHGDPFGVRPPAKSHPNDDVTQTVFVVGEREQWDAPRAITDAYTFAEPDERAAVEGAFVDAATGPTEYSDLWLAVQYRDNGGDDDE